MLLIVTVGLTVLLASGIAVAVTSVQCTSGVCKGTSGPEDMYGTRGGDAIYGRGGSDLVQARAGGDTISGGSGPDGIYDGEGNDTVRAGAGDDRVNVAYYVLKIYHYPFDGSIDEVVRRYVIFAGYNVDPRIQGNDVVFGGDGNDRLAGLNGTDVMHGGRGKDRIYARDGMPDLLYCDGGKDTVYYNKGIDTVFDCEHKNASSSTATNDDSVSEGEVAGFIRLR